MIIFKRDTLSDTAFFVLCFSIFASLNSITSMLFGISQLASPLILISCLTILLNCGVSKKSFKYHGVQLLYLVFLSYYLIGLVVRLFHVEIFYNVALSVQLMNLITSLIIILSCHQYLFKRLVVDKQEKIVFNSVYIPILISSFFALYQSAMGIVNITGDESGRVMGFFANPNALGMVANLGILCTLYSLYSHYRFTFIKFLFLPLLLYVSFLSLSRSSIITSVLLLVFGIIWGGLKFFELNEKSRRKFFLIAGIPLGGIIYLVVNFQYLIGKYLDPWQTKKVMTIVELIFEGKMNKETTSLRSEYFEIAYYSILDNPLFGKGLAYFQHIPNMRHGVHNTYFLIFGDAGIIPFTLYIIFISYIIIKGLFAKALPSFFSIGLIIIWALQNMGSHNGLDDKMANIIIILSTMYLFFGSKKLIKTKKINLA